MSEETNNEQEEARTAEAFELAKANRKEHPLTKTVGVVMVGAVAAAAGWLAREAVPQKHGDPAAAQAAAAAAAQTVPEVEVQKVRVLPINPPYEYIARVEPIQDVSLRAQVDGYIKQVHFTEGSLVEAGAPLFTIDPEQYEARIGVRNAEIGVAEANLDRAERLLKRLEASDPRAVIPSDLDKARADVASAKAAIAMAKSNLVLAEIDLKHTKIAAPITGRIGRTVANVGDYVAPSIGSLVRIVQTDPIRVAFSVNDKDYVRVRENIEDGKIQDTLRFRVKLPTGTVPDITGKRDFEDNTMSVGTASLSVRTRFDNKAGLLVPDGFVTMLVDFMEPAKVPAIPQMAVMTDGEGPFVYVVDAQGKADVRRVELGVTDKGLVAVKGGLKEGEQVVTLGIQKVAPGAPVAFKEAKANTEN
jgi:RND family efflux transporter MFP subunit